MTEHRQEDRNRGLTGETDPAKILAETQRIQAQEQAERDRLMRQLREAQGG